MSSDVPARPPAGRWTLPDDLRSDVLDIISDALQWQLPEARWPAIEGQVQALYDALQRRDLAGLETAVGDLESSAPLRINPIGGEPTVPATPKLRNLTGRVVHDLGEGLGADTRGSAKDQRDEENPNDAASR